MEQRETKKQPFLAEVSLLRERDGPPNPFKVRIYPAPEDPDDPRRYVVKDLEGNEVELHLKEKMQVDTLIFGKPEAQDEYALNRKRQPAGMKNRKQFPK